MKTLQQYIFESTWMMDDPQDTIKDFKTAKDLLEFLVDKKSGKVLMKEIRECEENFSVEIPMTFTKKLCDYGEKDLNDEWEGYSSDCFNVMKNLGDAFKMAWKKDYTQYRALNYEDPKTKDALKKAMNEASGLINEIIEMFNGRFFVDGKFNNHNLDELREMVDDLQNQLDAFHEAEMKSDE